MAPDLGLWLSQLMSFGGTPAMVGQNNPEGSGMFGGLQRPFDTSMYAHRSPFNSAPAYSQVQRANTNYPHVPQNRALQILAMLPYLTGTQPQKIAGGGIVGSP